jgi:hypothetical protein
VIRAGYRFSEQIMCKHHLERHAGLNERHVALDPTRSAPVL